MSAVAADLRYRARMCRELAKGREQDIAMGLRKLADEYDARADALEAAARKLD